MKRNIILFAICLCLGGYAYYSQEYLPQIAQSEQELPHFDYDKLTGISTANVELEINNQYEMISKYKVPSDPFIAKQVMELINNLRVERKITNEEVETIGENEFFPENDFIKLHFGENSLKLFIGKKISYSRSFYGGIEHKGEKQYFILKDKRPLVGMYDEQQYQRSDEHYLKIVGLLHLNEEFFIPQSQAIFMRGLTEMAIKTNLSKAYKIIFKDNQIVPKVFKEVKVNPKEIQEYINRLAKIKMKHGRFISNDLREDIFINGANFENLMGEIQFYYNKNEFIAIKVFKDESKKEMIFYNSRWNFAQVYRQSEFKFLFPHHQDFYFKIPFKKSDEIAEISKESSILELDQLSSYLSNGADWLSKIDKIDSQLLIEKLLVFKAGNKLFSLFKQNNDLVLVDDEEKIKYHYYRGMNALKKIEK